MENYPGENNEEKQPSEVLPLYPTLETKRRSFKYWGRRIALILGIFLLIGGIFWTYKIFSAGEKVFLGKKGNSLLSQIKRLILPPKEDTEISQAERINLLLIGIRGTGHNKDQGGGPYLADTIILLSIKPKTKQAAMLSLPRDLWVNIENYGWAKINTAYAYGIKEDSPEGGARLLSKTIEQITEVPLDYYVVIDFLGFEKAIDIIGGVDINVEQSFTDYFYPTWNYEYQTLSFRAGQQHMDGDKALKFVRSRHGTNGEGSDFARARRQQKVLVALKDKVFSIGTILNPIKITKLIDSLGNHIITNLELFQAKELLGIAQEIEADQIVNRVLENSNEGFLVASRSENGASILIPRTGDFSEIRKLAQNIFDVREKKETAKPKVEKKIKVQVRNGTTTPGLAGKIAVELKEAGYEIVGILNADTQDYEKTVIFDYTEGGEGKALSDLKEKLKANVAAGHSFFLEKSSEGRGGEADFVIILGRDQKL